MTAPDLYPLDPSAARRDARRVVGRVWAILGALSAGTMLLTACDLGLEVSPMARVDAAWPFDGARPDGALLDGAVFDGSMLDGSVLDAAPVDAAEPDGDVGERCVPPFVVVGIGHPYEVLLLDSRTFEVCHRLDGAGFLPIPWAVGMSESLNRVVAADRFQAQVVRIDDDTVDYIIDAPESIDGVGTVFTVQQPGTSILRLGITWTITYDDDQVLVTTLVHLDEEGAGPTWTTGNGTLPGAVRTVTADPRNRTLLFAAENDAEHVFGHSPATTRRTSETFGYLGLPSTYVESGSAVEAALLTGGLADGELRVAVAIDRPVVGSDPVVYYSDVEATNLTPYPVCGECSTLERALIDRRANGHVLLVCTDGTAATRRILRQRLGPNTCTSVLAPSDVAPQQIESAAISGA